MRIVEEAVTNILKHANASAVRIETSREARDGTPGAVVRISDDGIGIAPMDGGVTGRGLENMKQRATALGGSLRVAHAGKGTVVELWLPENL
jgi:signal transduction histidine kinase